MIETLAHSQNPDQRRLFGEMKKRMEQSPGMSLGYHWSSTVRDLREELQLGEEAAAILRDASAFLGRYDACLLYTSKAEWTMPFVLTTP